MRRTRPGYATFPYTAVVQSKPLALSALRLQACCIENPDKTLDTDTKRVCVVAPSEIFAAFMKSGWSSTEITGITKADVISHRIHRRIERSAAFIGTRLVIPGGATKVRYSVVFFEFPQ